MTKRFDQRAESTFEAPYDVIFDRVLRFEDFAAAEGCIRRIELLRLGFAAEKDLKGLRYCRRIGLLGRRRSEQISRNRRVGWQKRLEKKEIGVWFQTWLENPGIFDDWLAVRKQSLTFKVLQQSLGGTE